MTELKAKRVALKALKTRVAELETERIAGADLLAAATRSHEAQVRQLTSDAADRGMEAVKLRAQLQEAHQQILRLQHQPQGSAVAAALQAKVGCPARVWVAGCACTRHAGVSTVLAPGHSGFSRVPPFSPQVLDLEQRVQQLKSAFMTITVHLDQQAVAAHSVSPLPPPASTTAAFSSATRSC